MGMRGEDEGVCECVEREQGWGVCRFVCLGAMVCAGVLLISEYASILQKDIHIHDESPVSLQASQNNV